MTCNRNKITTTDNGTPSSHKMIGIVFSYVFIGRQRLVSVGVPSFVRRYSDNWFAFNCDFV
jgi:hypothetical protein